MTPDIVNALFELAAAGFVLNHCRVLRRDRVARGVSLLSTVFFTAWGAWNIVFYPAVGAFWSFVAGLAVLAANCLWAGMIFKTRWQETKG